MASMMAVCGGSMGPKGENVEKSYGHLARYSDMYRGEDKGGHRGLKKEDKQLFEENEVKCGSNPQA